MRRIVLSAIALLAAALLAPAVASARVVVQAPSAFNSNGDVISGWSWLRTKGASASWTFSADAVQSARSGSVYVLLSPLVTNGANGGAGYSRTIKLTVRHVTAGPTSVKPVSRTVSLYNPFRPIAPEDTGGIGYQTYGYLSVPKAIWRNADAITVSYRWTGGYHVAVKQDSASLTFRAP